MNCAAVPEDLVEAAFFGAAKGAFTGATSSREGFFRVADRGTLFLDEIGDMSLNAQAKVLRVLQENVRELQNVMERLVVLRPGAEIRPGDLQLDLTPGTPGPAGSPPMAGWNPYEGSSLPEALQGLERDLIQAASDRNGGNKARAAAEPGIPRTHLFRRMKVLGLSLE